MLNKFLFASILLFFSVKAKAQYIEYVPNTLPPPASSTDQRTTRATEKTEIVAAYSINTSTGTVKKYKLKIAIANRKIVVASIKELADEYWSNYHPINRPVVQKLTTYDELSDKFEYRVYVPTLGATLYF